MSRTRSLITATMLATGTVLLTAAGPAAAHEKWFVKDPGSFAADWSFAARPLVLVLLLGVVLATVGWRWVALRVGTPELRLLRPLGRLAPYIPRLLAIHLGVSLLSLAVGGEFLSHDLSLDGVAGGTVLLMLEGLLGVWLITGIRLRPAAVLLIVLGPFALLTTGPVNLLSSADLLGIAAFLALVPPSADRFGRVELDRVALTRALLALRVGVGTALITIAFAEKLANPAMARATVHAFPRLDVFAAVGLPVPLEVFVAIAGATEVLFGLLVLSGAMPQLAILVAGIPFNATLILFGAVEMLGHLPVYGVFLTLLVYGSNPVTAPWVRALPRLRRHSVRHSTAAVPAGR